MKCLGTESSHVYWTHSETTWWICYGNQWRTCNHKEKKEEERYELRIHGVIFQVTLLSKKVRFKSVYSMLPFV